MFESEGSIFGGVRIAKAVSAVSLGILFYLHASLGEGNRLLWQPAIYHGIEVGKSTISDVTRLLANRNTPATPKMNMTILFSI